VELQGLRVLLALLVLVTAVVAVVVVVAAQPLLVFLLRKVAGVMYAMWVIRAVRVAVEVAAPLEGRVVKTIKHAILELRAVLVGIKRGVVVVLVVLAVLVA